MNFLRLLPVVLSILLLSAHFLRAGWTALGYVFPAILLLLFLRSPWVARLMQVILLIGGLEWLRTLASLAAARRAAGEDWVRMAVILGVVAGFTLVSARVFVSPALRERYRLGASSGQR